ncbi:hypothetical protein FDECE_14646 [Fusarium decemcellulare]|nr:hypothetical protein FDECE_14646 [Fusarium decemcellulare]
MAPEKRPGTPCKTPTRRREGPHVLNKSPVPQTTGHDDNPETLQPYHLRQPSIPQSSETHTTSITSSFAIQPQTRFEKEAFPLLAGAWRNARDAMHAATEENIRIAKQEYLAPHRYAHSGPSFRPYWNNEDEAKLQEVWAGSLLEHTLEQTGSIHGQLIMVLNVSFQIFGRDPLALFSLRGDNLDMDTHGRETIETGGRFYKSPFWGMSFCRNLAMIMVHPLWDGKEPWAFILFVFKWAVICRTCDLRPLKPMDVDILEAAGCHISPSPPDLPFPDRLRNYREAIWDQGRWPTPESNLLITIADKTELEVHDSPSDLYAVTTKDPTTIIKSLDAMNKRGVVVPCKAYLQAFWGSPALQEWLCSSDIRLRYKRCWFDVERKRVWVQRIAAEQGINLMNQRPPIEKLQQRISNGAPN